LAPIWNINEDGALLDPEVRKQLLKIAMDFVKDLKDNNDIKIKIEDVVLLGSLTNYNWTPYSDVDLHIVVDFGDLDMSKEDAQTLFDAIKAGWNNKHNITMKGHDVELYVQDIDHEAVSASEYSVLRNEWVKEPVKEKPNFNKPLIKKKYKEYKNKIDKLVKGDSEKQLKALLDKLYNFRQAGLDSGGELSEENIVFKMLRAKGYIDKIKDNISHMYDDKMSVDEYTTKNKILENAPPQEQVHVFDFDDTLGVTDNPNGIMIYIDGKPAHKDINAAMKWIQSHGLEKHLSKSAGKGSVAMSPEKNGVIFYLDSAGLAKVQSTPGIKYVVYDPKKGEPKIPNEGTVALLDFTPSSNIDVNTTKPIKPTIEKLKSLNSAGAKTAVMTARQGSGEAAGLDGKTMNVTNEKDIELFLSKYNATPNSGIVGVNGKNKGREIEKKFVQGNTDDPPEEIHFYDDSDKNIKDVEAQLANKIPSNLYIYGPGSFDDGVASAKTPTKSFEKIKELLKRIIREKINKISTSDIHKLADKKGIKWDNEPSFLKLTKRLTGKEHLDDLNQSELAKIKKYLEKEC
jgi:hypothetical protein